MENKYYIYLHIKKTDGTPFYIGKGKCGTNRFNSSHGRNKFWHNIVNKYGYDVIIIENNLEPIISCEREQYWINRIGRRDLGNGPLVNMTDGGEGANGRIVAFEHRKFGEKNHFYGKTHNEDTKNKIKISNKKRVWSEESKNKLSNSQKGKIITQEIRDKISIKVKGVNNGMYGKKHNEDTKNKLRESSKNRITGTGYILLDTQTGIFYDSILKASIALCIKESSLSSMIAGRYRNKTNLIKV